MFTKLRVKVVNNTENAARSPSQVIIIHPIFREFRVLTATRYQETDTGRNLSPVVRVRGGGIDGELL